MRDLMKFCKVRAVMTTALLTFFVLSGSGCASGPHLEYEDPDPELVGKVIRFKIPIVYLDFSDPRDAKQDGFLYPRHNGEKIVRVVESKRLVDNPNGTLVNYPREEVKEGMEFTILGSYWERKDWFTREFAPDIHYIVLQDKKGVLSVCSRTFIHNEAIFSKQGEHDESADR